MIEKLPYYRFDTETVSLLAGYEVIFGQEMWRNVIVETTFWRHTEEAARQRTKQMLNKETRRSDWENDLKTKYQLSVGNHSALKNVPTSSVLESVHVSSSRLSGPLQELVL